MSRHVTSGLMAALAVLALGSPRVAFAQAQASPATPAPASHAADQHETHGDPQAPGPDLPPITEADRAAAFPDVEGHELHDDAVHYFVLVDRLEWQAAAAGGGPNWDTNGWIGRDLDRLWFRTEGHAQGGQIEQADVQLLYGRTFARWWEVVAGMRHDVRPGPAQTWAAFGLQGLAPYWFDVEATAYVGEGGRTALRLEAEYELLITNRLVLQPLAELNLYSRTDPLRGTGAGLSDADVGLRLRYEIRRELAPYLGVTWNRKFAATADLARAGGDRISETRFVTGVRLWF